MVEDQDFRILLFDAFYEQSKMRISAPDTPIFNYSKVMIAALALTPCQSVLHLGLGAGSLVRAVHCLDQTIEQHVVEIRQDVIDIAIQYFALPLSENLKLTCADAWQYLPDSQIQHDVIFADMFWSKRMEPLQTQQHFFQQCRRLLRDRGWLVINYMHESDINERLLTHLYGFFADILLCVTPTGNAILLAGALDKAAGLQTLYQVLPEFEAKLGCKMMALARRIRAVEKSQFC